MLVVAVLGFAVTYTAIAQSVGLATPYGVCGNGTDYVGPTACVSGYVVRPH